MKQTLALALVLATAACGSMGKPAEPMIHQFDEAEIAWSKMSGNNTVRASALLRQNGGGVVTCAGTQMSLIPASAYSNERMSRIYGNATRGFWKPLIFDMNPRVPEPDPAYVSAQTSRTCDAQGFVTFTNVPDGQYFLTAQVIWSTGGTYSYEGGYLMQRVAVEGGESKEVVLTN